ncbi:phage tail sheath subtilisin-like domain-containing protein [Escherichia coli]|uniref:phage tail sheath C-terminal domain-containing protein n=1 Tax=Escherichia coli TaxID=562 RepID=UPI0017F21116|nr:phage tail sheath C-terminal domain-containing protein [Escherichia coli]EEW1720858.1 phage tail protein [Escherichia coli]EFM2070046.1 phage tail protein [Escherichia coli]EJC3553820.1 phage tail sheath subtilisin-like domain-containing protein [Escherichia coli]EJL1875887.1 phage tail sheath subtilisin-like domain-containing protein [Escherichia coli]EMF1502550.1 phage tail sheath subtilisin-like domain-containing protein [Escherichia coli]
MSTNFLHGPRTLEYDDGTKEINTVDISVIGIVGTAPDVGLGERASLTWGSPLANNVVTFFPVYYGDYGNKFAVEIIKKGISGIKYGYSTLPDGTIKLTLGTDSTTTPERLAQDVVTHGEGRTAEDYICVGIDEDSKNDGIVYQMPVTSLTGGSDAPFPVNIPTLIAGSQKKAALLGAAGTLPAAITDILNQTDALIVVVRVDENTDATKERENVINGINVLLTSGQINQVTPRILIAPDYSANDDVAAALEVVTNKLRGVGYIDSPRTASPADVVNRRHKYSARMEILRPRVFSTGDLSDLSRPYSAIAAGLRARIDNEKGFWWSKSNQNIYGITGLEQVDDFIIGETNCTANLLNASQVSTIIRYDGFRHWGNYLCSLDPQWSFECVRRTADVIEDSIARAMMTDFIDRPIDLHLGTDVVESINAYLHKLEEQGAINGGRAWLDGELNTKESLAAGNLYINVDFGPKSPAQTITLMYRINNDYTVEALASLFKETA